jgi:hypothetical protein
MNNIEKQIIESAINQLFDGSRSRLGIVKPRTKEISHTMEHQHNSIQYAFELKLIESAFYESLTSAFRDIHSYKYLNDPTFPIALTKRLTAIGIPLEEQQKAIKIIDELKEEFQGKNFDEKQAGWHPDINEIADMTRNANNRDYKTTEPYTGGGPAPQNE